MLSPILAEALLFQPSRGDPGPPPALFGVQGESIDLTTSDSVRIQGWWYPQKEVGPEDDGVSPEVAPPPVAPAILLLHGNAGDISNRAPLAEGLLREGLSVLLLEYRGYGGSEGKPSEEGLVLDALAGYEFLKDRLGDGGRIMPLGRSMGGAIAARLASIRPTEGLILESAFTSLEGMARTLYPFVPGVLFRRLKGRFDTLASVKEVDRPILIVHGTDDEIVPFRMGEELREAAGSGAGWLEIAGAGHNDVFWVGGVDYFRTLARFARGNVRGEPSWEGPPR